MVRYCLPHKVLTGRCRKDWISVGLYVMRKFEEWAITAPATIPYKGNSTTNGDAVLENAFCSRSYKALIYSVNSENSRQDSVSKTEPKGLMENIKAK